MNFTNPNYFLPFNYLERIALENFAPQEVDFVDLYNILNRNPDLEFADYINELNNTNQDSFSFSDIYNIAAENPQATEIILNNV